MKDTFVSATLVESALIRVSIFSSLQLARFEARLEIDHEKQIPLSESKRSSLFGATIIDYRLNEPLELGHFYVLLLPGYGRVSLNVDEAPSFPEFDEKYSYEGDDLGFAYSKGKTSFALWAPLAGSVVLEIAKKGEEPRFWPMKRGDKGVYRLSLDGDYELATYLFHINNSGREESVSDPYAKASTPNGERSVVFDEKGLAKEFPLKNECLKPYGSSACDAIVYEGSVRDLSIDSHTDIVHKGRFLGLIEKGRKTDAGYPAGFDYLSSLGITHLQLLPLFDFKTVDERNPRKTYNWGYDPQQYFVPEGSYASDLEDPLSRIRDLRSLVAAYHEAGIRIVMDVVYNHVYEYASSVFERIVPNYFFRKRRDGSLSTTSGCGNDVASERPMVRKLILDACRWWIEYYGIDGFRIDLMGILDVTTVKMMKEEGLRHKPDFIVYGEGWDMGGDSSRPLAHMSNAASLPGVGFFNDVFRECVKRFLAGESSQKGRFEFCYLGSSYSYAGNTAKFLDSSQSVNYVECHDGKSYFDFLTYDWGRSKEEALKIAKLATACVLFSLGMPFIHAGQEIGQSKFDNGNTYNAGDVYNKFSYALLGERYEMSQFFKDCVSFRKRCPFMHTKKPVDLADRLDFFEENGLLRIQVRDEGTYQILINATPDGRSMAFSESQTLLFTGGGLAPSAGLQVENILVPAFSLLILSSRG